MHILGHAGRILRSYLHDLYNDSIQAFIMMTKLEIHEFCCKPCLTVSMPKIFELFFQLSQISPDGSEIVISLRLILSTMESVIVSISN
jgi:hypothetical protein